MIRIRFIYLYCLVIVVVNDQSIFGLASPFSHKFVALNLISYPISILLLYLNSGINSRIHSIAQFMDLTFSCLVWWTLVLWGKHKSPSKYWKSTRNLLFCWCPPQIIVYATCKKQGVEGWVISWVSSLLEESTCFYTKVVEFLWVLQVCEQECKTFYESKVYLGIILLWVSHSKIWCTLQLRGRSMGNLIAGHVVSTHCSQPPGYKPLLYAVRLPDILYTIYFILYNVV